VPLLQCLDNGQQDTVHVGQHVVVPEAQNPVAFTLQPGRALAILRAVNRVGVLAPVEFDDQPALQAGEIDDVGTARHRALEFAAGELAITQACPELLFRIGLVAAEIASI
jgi:hypothetical protein